LTLLPARSRGYDRAGVAVAVLAGLASRLSITAAAIGTILVALLLFARPSRLRLAQPPLTGFDRFPYL
jgi:hypothetical protein